MNATIVIFYIVPAVFALLLLIILFPLFPEMARGVANMFRRFIARVKPFVYVAAGLFVFLTINCVFLRASNAFYNFLFGWI